MKDEYYLFNIWVGIGRTMISPPQAIELQQEYMQKTRKLYAVNAEISLSSPWFMTVIGCRNLVAN